MKRKRKSGSVNDVRDYNFFITNNEIFDSKLAAAIGPHAFMVYCYVLRRGNQYGRCWPSKEGTAEFTGLSGPTVVKAMKTLVDSGLVKRLDKGGRYRLQIADQSLIGKEIPSESVNVVDQNGQSEQQNGKRDLPSQSTALTAPVNGVDTKKTQPRRHNKEDTAIGDTTPVSPARVEDKNAQQTLLPTESSTASDKPCTKPDPIFTRVPLLRGGAIFEIHESMVATLAGEFPMLEAEGVRNELNKLRRWNEANPKKRKSKGGFWRHVVGWMERAHDKASSAPGTRPGKANEEISMEQWLMDDWDRQTARIESGELRSV